MPGKNKEPKTEQYQKVTVRLRIDDVAKLRSYYPQGYNRIVRALIHRHLEQIDKATERELLAKGISHGEQIAPDSGGITDLSGGSLLQESNGQD